MTTVEIKPSEWGFTAYLPSGIAVAHSKQRPLLEEYIDDCLALGRVGGTPPGQVTSVDRGVPASGDDLPGAGARAGGSAGAAGVATARTGGAPLTEITYTTRARSTGATVSAGRTAVGWGALCASHGETAGAKNRSEAETIVSRPQEWCNGCAPIAAGTEPKIAKNALLEELL